MSTIADVPVKNRPAPIAALGTLKSRLDASPYTRVEIARRIGVSPQTLWRWETDGLVKVRDAVALAGLLGCRPGDLVEGLRE